MQLSMAILSIFVVPSMFSAMICFNHFQDQQMPQTYFLLGFNRSSLIIQLNKIISQFVKIRSLHIENLDAYV